MSKIVITYNQIYELNQLLESQDINYKIHLHDACGSQSFTIETKEDEKKEQFNEMSNIVKNYFEEKGVTIQFTHNKLEFFIV